MAIQAEPSSAYGGPSFKEGPRLPESSRQGPRSSALSSCCYGALDLGTNNCRLLIACPTSDDFRVIDSFSRIVRLGEGVATTGRLSKAAIDRSIEALDACAGKIAAHQAARFRCVATEACRRAVNADSFIERVYDETGLSIEIIEPDEEVRLAVRGCAPLFDGDYSYGLMFDIGGGSTELAWLALGNGPPRRLGWISLPIGVMTLAENYGATSLNDLTYQRIIDDVRGRFEAFDRRFQIHRRIEEGRVRLLGMSGTVTTLAAVHMGLQAYKRIRVDGAIIPFAAFSAVCDRLRGLDMAEVAGIPCIGRQRADLMAFGCAILEAIGALWPVVELRVADRGLREGILLELMSDSTAEQHKPSGQETSTPV